MRCGRAEMARVFGVTPAAIDGWVRKGCPVKEPTRGPGYDRGAKFWIPDVVTWRERSLSSHEEIAEPAVDNSAAKLRTRLLRTQAESAEFDLRQKKEFFLTVAEYESAIAAALERVAAKITASVPNHARVGSEVGSMIDGVTSHTEIIEALLEDLCAAEDVPLDLEVSDDG